MKKLSLLVALLPALTFAHESHTHNSVMHSVEHLVGNPMFFLALTVTVAGGVFAAVKFFAAKKTDQRDS